MRWPTFPSSASTTCSWSSSQIRPVVEPDVVVGAQAQHIGGHVGPIVGSAKRSDVRAFGVAAARHLDRCRADLAGVVIQLFDLLDDHGAAYQPLLQGGDPRGRTGLNRVGCAAVILGDEAESQDEVAGLAAFLPVLINVDRPS
jgi:hypothetical protein